MTISNKWEEIDPAIAMRYIESMEGNRSVRQARVDYYAGQMKAGLWRPTHQGIAFDSDGHMVDGQHRMWAIVESGATVRIMVSRGVNPEDVVAIDNGLSRDYQDIAHYVGWETNPMTAAVAKLLVNGVSVRASLIPPEVAHLWYKHYQQAIDFALELRNHNRVAGRWMTLAMTVAFARAWFSCDHAALIRMGEALRTGVVAANTDKAALALRDAWITRRIGTLATEQYAKTEAAIRAFVERRAINKLQGAESELFPIPKLPIAIRYERVNTRPSTRQAKGEKIAKAAA